MVFHFRRTEIETFGPKKNVTGVTTLKQRNAASDKVQEARNRSRRQTDAYGAVQQVRHPSDPHSHVPRDVATRTRLHTKGQLTG